MIAVLKAWRMGDAQTVDTLYPTLEEAEAVAKRLQKNGYKTLVCKYNIKSVKDK